MFRRSTFLALASIVIHLLFTLAPLAMGQEEDTAANGLVCRLQHESVVRGEPVIVHLEGTRLAKEIDFQVVTVTNDVPVSGTLNRSQAVSEASDRTSVTVDTAGLIRGTYHLIVKTSIGAKKLTCQADFSVTSPTAAELPPPPEENYQRVKLFFATDRAVGNKIGDVQGFTFDRSVAGAITFGAAEVSIPRDHRMGNLERPSLLKLEFREDPEKHIVLLRATVLEQEGFVKEVRDRIDNDPERQALIFVHGYDVTFDEAARRLAQITYDLGFGGAPILYSWPSKGTLLKYTADEATIDWTIPHFERFLHIVAEQTGAKTLFLVAHSMGNRVLSGALKSIADKGQTLRPELKEIVMAAPDIDAEVFEQLAAAIRTTGVHFTIYESSKDLALQASHFVHNVVRLGDSTPTVHIFDGYDVIDASNVETGFLGHSYVMESASIVTDIFELFKGTNTALRPRLSPLMLNGKPYWSFKK